MLHPLQVMDLPAMILEHTAAHRQKLGGMKCA